MSLLQINAALLLSFASWRLFFVCVFLVRSVRDGASGTFSALADENLEG